MILLLLLLLSAAAAEDDVACLKGFKSSISDPDGHLSSWNFSNATVGFICDFTGVACWNLQENRAVSLSLPSSSLSGQIPSALRLCSSITTLDLSSNSLSGPIPPQLCSWLPYLVSLDISSNSLSGEIPANLSNCKFLNKLHLADNRLSGQIPDSLSRLDRLKELDLSSNDLSGQIPDAMVKFGSTAFAGNPSLCGPPISSSCSKSVSKTSLVIIIAAGVVGAVVSMIVAYAVWRFCFSAKARRKKAAAAAGVEEGRRWSDRMRSSQNRLLPVSLFQKPISKVRLADLMAATADFHPDYIVVAGSSRIGTAYHAVLRDGSALTVKRLHDCPLKKLYS